MISVAMTTYNGEAYVARQLYSILDQTLPADEIVICDDCSKDRTVEIIKAIIAETGDNRICLIENPHNLGYTRNFSKAISLTKGNHIFLADQDDEWHPDKMERTLQVLQETGASAVCTNCHFIDQSSIPITDASFDRHPFIYRKKANLTRIPFYELAQDNIAQGCTYCFTREVKERYLKINSIHVIHDYQIMLVAASIGSVYFLDEALIDYRLHSNNAVGFQKSSASLALNWKRPARKPEIILFLEDMEKVLRFPAHAFFKLLYYFRVPKIILQLRKKWHQRCHMRGTKSTDC